MSTGGRPGVGAALTRAFAVACLVLGAVCARATAPVQDEVGVREIRFRTWSTGEGLSQATARAIAQDRDGFLWVGTQDGLNRFDGYGFRTYRHDRNDPWSLTQNHVWALAADPDGSLWVGTQAGGLNRYDPALDRFVAYTPATQGDGPGSRLVSALLLDRAGRVLVANGDGRLQWVDRRSNRLVDTGIGEYAALRMVRALLQARDGSFWIGTFQGLFHADAEATSMVEVRGGALQPLDVYALAQTADGDLWVGTAETGLYRLSEDGDPLAQYRRDGSGRPFDIPDDEVRSLLLDADGGLWIGGNTRGLAWLDPQRRHVVGFDHDASRADTLGGDRVPALFRERNGLLFVGTWSNGFSMHDPRARALALMDRVDDAGTRIEVPAPAIFADADSTLWIGIANGGGLLHADLAGHALRHYRHDATRPDSLSHDFVYYIRRTRDGSLWVATMGGGLNKLKADASGFEHVRHDADDGASLGSDNVTFIGEDRAGTLWAGTLDAGLDERCSGCTAFRHHRHDPADATSAAGDVVTGMLELRNGEIWVSYRTEGLDRLDRKSGRFEHFRTRSGDRDSISSDSVSVLAEDAAGNLWIGTQGGGLGRRIAASGGATRFETLDVHDGLAADAIGAIIETAPGTLWVSTTAGISRIERAGSAEAHIVNYGGHAGAQPRGYWINGGTRLPDGRIAFGGFDGISIVDPERIQPAPQPRPVVTGLLLSNVPATLRWRDDASPIEVSPWHGGKVVLRHDQDNVTFEFSALDFSDPEAVLYAYRLDGISDQWIETASARRLATYTGLGAGSYKLRLRVRQPGQPWIESAGPLELRVLPAPWLSPTAYALYTLMAALTLVLAFLIARTVLRRRSAVQDAMRHSAERLKLALWGSGSELWDVDMASGRMVRENRLEHMAANTEAAEQTIGAYEPFVHPDDIESFRSALRAHMRGETPTFECSYRTLDKQHRWVWILTRGRGQRDASGRMVRVSGTTHDINELKSAEEALRALNEELESRVEQRTLDLRNANYELRRALDSLTLAQRQLVDAEKLASLGGMVAGIAHEINTPLGISVTAASHLHEEARRVSRLMAGGELTRSGLQRFEAAARESTAIVLRNLQRADRLIRSFKQVAVDQSSEERRVVDLGKSLDEIVTTLGPSLKSNACRIVVECPQLIVVETAPGALYQVITNLVMNSLTHGFVSGTPGGLSRPSVASEALGLLPNEIRIEARRDDATVRIDYRDNGKGMDEEVRRRIFEPFFTTRRGQGGSGLGLHIAYNLVTQALHGSIECISAPGKGVLFRIVLPATVPDPAPADMSARASQDVP